MTETAATASPARQQSAPAGDGATASGSIARLRDLFAGRHGLLAAARNDAAGPVVGCISPNVPVEIVLAAGAVPVRVFGDPSRPPEIGDTYMEEEFDGEVRSLFDRMLSGAVADCDLVLLPRTSECYLQLKYYVDEVRIWEPGRSPPEVQLLDLMQTPFWSTGRYVRDRFDELATRLGAMTGTPVTPARLADAIAETNGTRRRLRALNAFRRAAPPTMRGSDVLAATALFGALPAARLDPLLEELAAAAQAGDAGDRPRLMIAGSAHDDLGFYELVEAEGGDVVADDHTAGEGRFAALIAEDMAPMEALVDHYQCRSPSLRLYPQKARDRRFLETVKAAEVEGVLFVLEDTDDTLGWDFPPRRKALAALGIPSMLLAGQSYFAPDRAAQRAAVADFVREVGRRRGAGRR